MATTTNSQFSLSLKDGLRGALLAVISAVLTALLPIFQAGYFKFNWPAISAVAGTTLISYLIKNFFTPSEIVIQNPPKDQVDAVKSGEAVAKVVPTITAAK